MHKQVPHYILLFHPLRSSFFLKTPKSTADILIPVPWNLINTALCWIGNLRPCLQESIDRSPFVQFPLSLLPQLFRSGPDQRFYPSATFKVYSSTPRSTFLIWEKDLVSWGFVLSLTLSLPCAADIFSITCANTCLVKNRWISGGLGEKARLTENPSTLWKKDYSDSVVPVSSYCKMYYIMQQRWNPVQI